MKTTNEENTLVGKFISLTPFVEKEHLVDYIHLINELSSIQSAPSVEQVPVSNPLYLSLENTCQCFNLSKRCLSDRNWRRRNGFPTGNDMWGGKLSFSKVEVEEWMKKRCA